MQCDQLQQHIDGLLDRREEWRSDGRLVAHLADCPSCRRLADAYETMLLAVELRGTLEPGELVGKPLDDRGNVPAPGRRGAAIALAVAASMLVIVLFGRFLRSTPHSDSANSRSGLADSAPTSPLLGESATAEVVGSACHSTGQQLADLPQTVRRVASLPGTDPIVGHIRPFTDPVGATWHILLRAWPGATTPTAAIPDTDTSLLCRQLPRYA